MLVVHLRRTYIVKAETFNPATSCGPEREREGEEEASCVLTPKQHGPAEIKPVDGAM